METRPHTHHSPLTTTLEFKLFSQGQWVFLTQYSKTAGSSLARLITSHRGQKNNIRQSWTHYSIRPSLYTFKKLFEIVFWFCVGMRNSKLIHDTICAQVKGGGGVSLWEGEQVKYGFQPCLERPADCSKTLKAGRQLWETMCSQMYLSWHSLRVMSSSSSSSSWLRLYFFGPVNQTAHIYSSGARVVYVRQSMANVNVQNGTGEQMLSRKWPCG